MPEAAEVKLIAEALSRRLCGRLITDVKPISGRYVKKPIPGSEQFPQRFPSKVQAVGCHGKFIYAILDSDMHLHNTLGMTGTWSPEKGKHSRVEVVLDDGSVFFNDIRNFGTLKFVPGRVALVKKLKSFGPDVLGTQTTPDELAEAILAAKLDRNICRALLDQTTIAGVGNYIKAEALWRAKLSPMRDVSFFSRQEILELCRDIMLVAGDAYRDGGNTLKDFRNFDGQSGLYKNRLCVYNRRKDRDGNTVVKTKTPDGRTTWWVPERQV